VVVTIFSCEKILEERDSRVGARLQLSPLARKRSQGTEEDHDALERDVGSTTRRRSFSFLPRRTCSNSTSIDPNREQPRYE